MPRYVTDGVGSRSTKLDEALDTSLVLLERGSTPEDCVARFPEHAEELRPLLEVAAQIRRVPAPTPPPTWGANGKQRMLEALAQKQAAPPTLLARIRAWIGGLLEGSAEQGLDVQRLLRSAAVAAAVVVMIAVGTVAVRSWRGMMVQQEAVLRAEDGLVEVLPSGADAWEPVSEAMLVAAGDRIRTGAEGSAELMFFDGSITALGPGGELTIARMASQRSGRGKVIVLHQWIGEVYNQVQPLADEESRFRVETASAVVSVRGTAFSLTVEPDGATKVRVNEGAVEVQTRETSVLISGGEEIQVESPQASATPTRLATPGPTEAPISPSPTELPAIVPPWTRWLTETPEPSELEGLQPTQQISSPQPAVEESPAPSSREETDEPSQPSEETEEPTHKWTPPGHTNTPEPPGQTVPPGQEKKTPQPSNNDDKDKKNDDGDEGDGGGGPPGEGPPGKNK
jgi:hypothetical protein